MTADSPPLAQLAPLQKTAVLIHSHDMRAADALLDQMPAAQAARVREALLELTDVPAELQEAVIGEFLSSGGKLPIAASSNEHSDGVELELSSAAAHVEYPLAPPAEINDSRLTGFAFLQDASPGLLADFLRQEHPQTVAVILANLDPDQAARVLERLPAELSTESLARMARLHQLSPEVLTDLAEEIRLQLLPRIDAERRPQGLAGASAVLSALNDPLRRRMLGQLAHRDQSLVRQLGYLDANQPPPARTAATSMASTQAAKLTIPAPVAPTVPARKPTTISFADLAELGDASLKRVFAQAEPQVVILALTGADERFVNRILRQLPTREAAALQRCLNHPGPLRLRDVDAAQQELAAIAVDLHEQQVIRVPQLQSQHLSLQS
jgi:flagellar motor switch protein FliG